MSDKQPRAGKARSKSAASAIANDVMALIEHADPEDIEEVRRQVSARLEWVTTTPGRGRKLRAARVLGELGRLTRRRNQATEETRGHSIAPATGDPEAEQAFAAADDAYAPTPTAMPFERILSGQDMAHALGVSKPTLFKQMREGRVLGWLDQRNRGCFPADQLDQFGRVPNGIPEVLSQFSDPVVAWWWLTGPKHSLEDRNPLDLLKNGEASRALDAAKGAAMGAFN